MDGNFIALASRHYADIATCSVGVVLLTSAILSLYRDHLKRSGRRVHDVKYWSFHFSDRVYMLGYAIAFWQLDNGSLAYNFLLTVWRVGIYAFIASGILAILQK